MAEQENIPPVVPPVEDSPQGGQPTDQGNGGKSPAVDPAEQARRDQQSKKDQAIADKSGLEEQVEYLSAREAERARDTFVSDLLTKEAEKYPNVKADNPLFKYAASKEEVSEIAAQIQNQFTDLQQDALRSVQTEVETLTDEQIAEREKELEAETNNTGRSNFGGFLSTIQRRKK